MARRGSVSDRLAARADRQGSDGGDAGGLASRRFGGVEVFSGRLAGEALGALGARAMTMDGAIIVDQGFDPLHDAEDASLLMHEDEHRRGSGGEGGGAAGHTDAEEQRARGVESMTLHLMESGASLDEVVAQVRDSTPGQSSPTDADANRAAAALVSRALIGGDKDRNPMDAYLEMRATGKSHRQIVDELVRHVIETLDRVKSEHTHRTGEGDFFR